MMDHNNLALTENPSFIESDVTICLHNIIWINADLKALHHKVDALEQALWYHVTT